MNSQNMPNELLNSLTHGEINVEKISNVEPLLNLGRKLRIGKSGQPSLTSSIKNKVSSIKPEKPSGPRAFTGYKKPEPVIEKPEIQNTKYDFALRPITGRICAASNIPE